MIREFRPDSARRNLATRATSVNGLRVLHVIGTLDRGGAETFLLNLVRSCADRPDEIYVLCYGDKHFDLEKDFVALGVHVHRIARGSSLSQQWRAIRAIRPDVVHAHTDLNTGIALIAAWLNNVELKVAHSHNTVFGRRSPSRLRALYQRTMMSAIGQLADLRLACGDEAGTAMFGGQDYYTQQNGVDIEQFRFSAAKRQELRAELLPSVNSEDQLLLGVVARLEPVKNHEFMLGVFEDLLHELPHARLILVGRGSCESALRDRAQELGISRAVHFLGVREDVADLLSAFDAVVLPSFYEGFPVSMIEAQINGVPLIASDRVDSSAILNSNCFSLPIKGVDAEKDWVQTILEIAHGRTGRVLPSSRALTFDAQNIGTQVFNHYQAAISKDSRC